MSDLKILLNAMKLFIFLISATFLPVVFSETINSFGHSSYREDQINTYSSHKYGYRAKILKKNKNIIDPKILVPYKNNIKVKRKKSLKVYK